MLNYQRVLSILILLGCGNPHMVIQWEAHMKPEAQMASKMASCANCLGVFRRYFFSWALEIKMVVKSI